jgi:hypothetical protein
MRFAAMSFLTGGFFFVELFVGVAIGSLSLQADAWHMASDLAALLVGFYAARISKKQVCVCVCLRVCVRVCVATVSQNHVDTHIRPPPPPPAAWPCRLVQR